MQRKKFVSLLRQYLKGQLPDKSRTIIDEWFSAIGRNESVDLLTQEQEEELRMQYQAGIKTRIHTQPAYAAKRSFGWAKMGIAASVLILISIGGYLYTSFQATVLDRFLGYETIVNEDAHEKTVSLPDGSKVTLAQGSKLKYFTSQENNTRNVLLSGAAFFDVVRNPNKPFMVHSGHITTKVLGTSFRVENSALNEEVKVTVRTGLVAVFEDINNEGIESNHQRVILTPNQQVIYRSKEKILVSQLVELPQEIPEIKKKYNDISTLFEQAPVSEIFDSMEKLYGIPIRYDSILFSNCKLTTSLEGGDLYNRLSIYVKY